MPSENSQEDLDNSALLLIGKPTIDAAPVPIHLGMDDVNKEISKLRLPTETNGDPQTKPSTTGVTTTTIITNLDGSILSMTTDTMLKSLPSSPKTKGIPSDDSPGSPHGDFKLRSYKLKKKGTKTRKYACKSCGAVKSSIQELNEHHKWRHKQVMCGTCSKLFDAPLQLARHMYEHYEKKYSM